jgi:signal transduction histidine kinase
LDNGISQIEILSPYRFWNDDKGIHGNFIDVAKIKNNLYVSTLSGVFLTNSQNTSNTELNTFKPVEGTFGQTWGFLYFQPPVSKQNNNPFKDSKISNRITTDETLLLISTNKGVFQIIDDKSILISDYKKVFLSYQYKKDPNVLFLGLAKGIAMLSYKNGKWKDHGLKFGISDMIKDINEDTLGNLWLKAEYKGLYKIEKPLKPDLDFNEIEFFDTLSNLPLISSVQTINYQDTLLFRNDEMNYFTYNPENKNFELYELPENAFEDAAQQNIFTDTISIYRVREDRSSIYYVINDEDPYYWFGTNMGVFRYSYSQRNLLDVSPTLIRKVLAGDSLIFNGTNYREIENHEDSSCLELILDPNPIINNNYILEYKDNSLKFFFASPYFEEESKNTYSYCLNNFNSDWSNWTIENKKEYTNLREGDYVFKVKSKNIYNIETSVAEFKFTILPPWYRTFGAFIGYFIFGVLFIILIVKLYTYRLIKEKDNLENIVIERTQEILMQKEEIIVQSEHLKDANDVIVARNEELENQKLEIEAQRDKLAVINATKNKFFRIIAHDLRNPISTLAGSTNLIFNSYDDFSKSQTKEFIGDLNKLSQTTFNLLENLLDWSSTQMGEIKFSPRPIDIKSLTAENLELIRSKINSKNIELNVNIKKDTMAFADENMVKTVIRNLLSNAVKFTPENGKIEISCKLKTDYLIYTVKDSGIGIKEDDLKKLFRIDTHHTTPGLSNEKGSGLGLILCKEFVEKNGGNITITSELNKGTSINFTLKKHIS